LGVPQRAQTPGLASLEWAYPLPTNTQAKGALPLYHLQVSETSESLDGSQLAMALNARHIGVDMPPNADDSGVQVVVDTFSTSSTGDCS